MTLKKNSRIFLAGHNGMVGSAILRALKKENYKNILTEDRRNLDLEDQGVVYKFLRNKKPDYVIIAAAKVGGIFANDNEKDKFLLENINIQNNLIHGSFINNIKNILFLGSSCIYPKFSKQPIKETELLSGYLEPTNEAYALAKIVGIKLCSYYSKKYNLNYRSLLPCNLFGERDNYSYKNSHFVPALIRKIYEAKINNKKYITLWGNGKAKREILHVDDFANSCLYFMKKKIKEEYLNIGSGEELTINQFAKKIMGKFDINLKIKYQNKLMNGTPRKILNCSLARSYGWDIVSSLDDRLEETICDFKNNYTYYCNN